MSTMPSNTLYHQGTQITFHLQLWFDLLGCTISNDVFLSIGMEISHLDTVMLDVGFRASNGDSTCRFQDGTTLPKYVLDGSADLSIVHEHNPIHMLLAQPECLLHSGYNVTDVSVLPPRKLVHCIMPTHCY